MLILIGGDGTHRGAYLISQEAIKRKLNISVVGNTNTNANTKAKTNTNTNTNRYS
jgi:6-phosphofructokinase